MLDAFEIGVRLSLDDKILGSLSNVDAQFQVVERTVARINDMLTTTVGITSGLASASGRMASAWGKAADAANKMATAAAKVATPGPPGMNGSIYAPPGAPGPAAPVALPGANTPRALNYYPATPSDVATIPGQSSSGYQGWGTDDNPYVPPWTRPDVNMGDGQPPTWSTILGGTDGGGGGPYRPGPRDSNADPLSIYWYGTYAAHLARVAVTAPFDAAATVDQKIAVMQNAGIPMQTAQQAYALASNMQGQKQYSTLSLDQLLSIIEGNLLQTHNIRETSALMPTLANTAIVLQGQGDNDAATTMQDLTRAGDLAGMFNRKNKDGSVDTGPFEKFLETIAATEQAAAAAGDAISPNQILKLYQNMGAAGQTLSPEGIANSILLALTLGQEKAGTGLGQVFKEFVGGKMPVGIEEFLGKAGLIDTKGAIRHGQYVTLAPNSLQDENLLLADPQQWLATVFAPTMQKLNPNDRAALIHDVYAGTSTQQGARVALDSIFNDPLISRYFMYSQNVPNLATAAANYTNTPSGKAAGAANAVNAMLVTLSNDSMPVITGALNAVRWGANAVNNALNPVSTAGPWEQIGDDIGAALFSGFVGTAVTWGAKKIGPKIGIAMLGGEAVDPLGGGVIAALATAIAEAIVSADRSTDQKPDPQIGRWIARGSPVTINGNGPSTMPGGVTGRNNAANLPPAAPGLPLRP